MPDTSQNLLILLQRSLRKSASSALPAAPKVPNPAPQPLKTPSFTTKPPTVGKAVADVRPGTASMVTPKTQSLGTAKSTGAKQTAVSTPIMPPKEFKAIPTVPLAKTAQQHTLTSVYPNGQVYAQTTSVGPTRFNAGAEKSFGNQHEFDKTYVRSYPDAERYPDLISSSMALGRGVTPDSHARVLAAVSQSMPPAASSLRNQSFGSRSRTTGEPAVGHGSYAGARDWLTYSADEARAAEAAKAKAYAAEQAKANQKPENPHYANRPAQLKVQAERQSQEALERYAKDDPTVVKRKPLGQILREQRGFKTWGDRLDAALGPETQQTATLTGQVSGPGWWRKLNDGANIAAAAARGAVSREALHDMANNAQLQVNRARAVGRQLYGLGARYLNPANWGDSLTARKRRLSIDNETDNATRAIDEERNKILENYQTGLGDVDTSLLAKLNYGGNAAIGEFAAGELATAGVGGAAKGLAKGVTAGGRALGAQLGRGVAAGASRLGASAQHADRIRQLGEAAGTEFGKAVAAPARYVGRVVGGNRPGTQNGYEPLSSRIAYGVSHTPGAVRSAVGGTAAAGRNVAKFVRNPWQNKGMVWDGTKWVFRQAGNGLEAGWRAQNAYTVANGVANGDFKEPARSAGELAWFDFMRHLNPRLGLIGGLAPVVLDMTGGQEDE